MLVVRDLVEVDSHITVDGYIGVIIMIIIVSLLLVLGSSIGQEGQIPPRLLPVRLESCTYFNNPITDG